MVQGDAWAQRGLLILCGVSQVCPVYPQTFFSHSDRGGRFEEKLSSMSGPKLCEISLIWVASEGISVELPVTPLPMSCLLSIFLIVPLLLVML